MRRISILVPFLAALAAGLALWAAPWSAAQSGTPMAAGPGFVGAWHLAIAGPGSPPTQGLTTFMADGTLLSSDPPVSPAGQGAPVTVSSAGHGLWQQTGAGTAALTFVELATDQQGTLLGTVTVAAQVTLSADGNGFSGPYRVTVADPSGKVLFQGQGSVRATRITVQPLASPPAGTPTA